MKNGQKLPAAMDDGMVRDYRALSQALEGLNIKSDRLFTRLIFAKERPLRWLKQSVMARDVEFRQSVINEGVTYLFVFPLDELPWVSQQFQFHEGLPQITTDSTWDNWGKPVLI